jgi:hypothetical protein
MHRQKIILIASLLSFACRQNTNQAIKKPINAIKKSINDTTILTHSDTIKKIKGVIYWDRESTLKKIILPSKLTTYIGKNYEPLDTALGDVNGDKIGDLLLVTCIHNENSLRYEPKTNKRELLLFIGQSDGSFKLTFRNKNAIPCINCCGMSDSFGGISMQEGEISITNYCASNWKSLEKYNFKLNKKDNNLYLDNVINESFCFDYQDYSCDTTKMKARKRIGINLFDIIEEE